MGKGGRGDRRVSPHNGNGTSKSTRWIGSTLPSMWLVGCGVVRVHNGVVARRRFHRVAAMISIYYLLTLQKTQIPDPGWTILPRVGSNVNSTELTLSAPYPQGINLNGMPSNDTQDDGDTEDRQ
jgi:hypothetical protein